MHLLLTVRSVAVCVSALGRMNQVLDALLDSFSSFLVRCHRIVIVVASKDAVVGDLLFERLMFVLRTDRIVALGAEIEVAADLAVESCGDSRVAVVAGEGFGREAIVRVVKGVQKYQ